MTDGIPGRRSRDGRRRRERSPTAALEGIASIPGTLFPDQSGTSDSVGPAWQPATVGTGVPDE